MPAGGTHRFFIGIPHVALSFFWRLLRLASYDTLRLVRCNGDGCNREESALRGDLRKFWLR